MDETQRTLDEFWNKHAFHLRLCLQLRQFELDFRELQVNRRKATNFDFVFHFFLADYRCKRRQGEKVDVYFVFLLRILFTFYLARYGCCYRLCSTKISRSCRTLKAMAIQSVQSTLCSNKLMIAEPVVRWMLIFGIPKMFVFWQRKSPWPSPCFFLTFTHFSVGSGSCRRAL